LLVEPFCKTQGPALDKATGQRSLQVGVMCCVTAVAKSDKVGRLIGSPV
jgi:hypothetical protein